MSSTYMMSTATATVDVLVLGAGLAGMRAAWGALEADPRARVAVADLKKGPSGSSFANKNNVLGMQALFSDEEQLDFFQAAVELARPGFADPGLVRILASESAARLKDMEGLGLKFRKSPHGKYLRAPGCFTPNFRHAVVFSDLGHAFTRFRKRLDALGAGFLSGFRVVSLVQEKSPEGCGKFITKPADHPRVFVPYRCCQGLIGKLQNGLRSDIPPTISFHHAGTTDEVPPGFVHIVG